MNYQNAAQQIGCELAAIIAVDTVESRGSGMVGALPKILFEPHVFWKELRKAGLKPEDFQKANADILYPTWNSQPYPRGSAEQQNAANWERMNRAIKIHREAALKSASYGRFQIMGFNHKMCGCQTVQDFVNRMYKGDADHLQLFVAYIIAARLDDELRAKDWAGFARSYNGPLYAKNAYDTKLKKAYEAAKKI